MELICTAGCRWHFSNARFFRGFIAALIAGLFYGMTFVPVIYMMDNPDKFPSFPDDSLAYVFSHYFGIFLTATVIFIGYAMVK